MLEYGLQVHTPQPSKYENYRWCTPFGSPYGIEVNIKALKSVVQHLRSSVKPGDPEGGQHFLAKFDATRDLRGTFYCQEYWKEKHEELREELENCFGTNLNDNGNSFSSCFQFEEQPRPGHIRRRFKVYNKMLALT